MIKMKVYITPNQFKSVGLWVQEKYPTYKIAETKLVDYKTNLGYSNSESAMDKYEMKTIDRLIETRELKMDIIK